MNIPKRHKSCNRKLLLTILLIKSILISLSDSFFSCIKSEKLPPKTAKGMERKLHYCPIFNICASYEEHVGPTENNGSCFDGSRPQKG